MSSSVSWGAGKTTAIARLIDQRPVGEQWSVLINEFGKVSIDHALVDSELVDSDLEGVAVEELGGGCACCTMAMVFKPLLAQFIRRTKPDRLILEPSGLSHPAKVIDILRSPNFASVISLRNIICLIDPKDFEDPRWRETAVFQDQVQLSDIVVLNWCDSRKRDLIDRCREWVDTFHPPKQLITETSFGELESELLDREFSTERLPIFADAHAANSDDRNPPVLDLVSEFANTADDASKQVVNPTEHRALPGRPLRFRNDSADYDACGWIFHVDDVFDRDELLDLLGYVHPIVRLKGVFRCEHDWWVINRAKESTSFATTTYRRDSRLEIILDRKTPGWHEFEVELLQCLVDER